MPNFFRDYFTFNRREKKGVVWLLGIILILLTYLGLSKYFVSRPTQDFSVFEKEISAYEEAETKKNVTEDSLDALQKVYTEHDYKLPSPGDGNRRFEFDPNGLPEEDWKRLGLSDKQVNVIKNYEAKGGHFRRKEDLKKMYCITPSLYASLEPYIRIRKADSLAVSLTKKYSRDSIKLKPRLLVELNAADSIQLDKLKGIGFTFAYKIIKYREKLGGYMRREQLLEVYGFTREMLDAVAANITVDSTLVTRININTATFDDLKKHPYIKYNLANLIVTYRRQHGSYHSLSDLRRLDLVNDETYRKIAPYLKTE